jgi:RNA polymerase sigma-70 factor (ECF subfamily)
VGGVSVGDHKEGNVQFDFHAELTGAIPHLRAFARSLSGDADRADDLVQDAILRALRAESQFTPGTNFRAWIFTILRNQYVNQLRRRKFVAEPKDGVDLDLLWVPPSQDAKLEFQDFRRALMMLTPDQREILLMVGASGFSYEEAAEICGCAVGTVKSRLSRARRELSRLLNAGRGLARRSDFTGERRGRGSAAAPAKMTRGRLAGPSTARQTA